MVLIIEKTGIIKRLRSHVTFKLVLHFLEFPGWNFFKYVLVHRLPSEHLFKTYF